MKNLKYLPFIGHRASLVPEIQAPSIVDACAGDTVNQSPAMPMLCSADQTKSDWSLLAQRLIGKAAPHNCNFAAVTAPLPTWVAPVRVPGAKLTARSTAPSKSRVTSSSLGVPSKASWGTLCCFPNVAELRTVQASKPSGWPPRLNLAVFEDSHRKYGSVSMKTASYWAGMTPTGTSNTSE